jgi:hypothetical protein
MQRQQSFCPVAAGAAKLCNRCTGDSETSAVEGTTYSLLSRQRYNMKQDAMSNDIKQKTGPLSNRCFWLETDVLCWHLRVNHVKQPVRTSLRN